MNEQKIVIVGAGHAGVAVAASLRQLGFSGRIKMMDEENSLPYQKPPLSKNFLFDNLDDTAIQRFDSTYFKKNNIETTFGVSVVNIDRSQKQVLLENEEVVSYDFLILATGSKPRSMPISGQELDGLHYLRSKNDAKQLRETLNNASTLAIVGGGYIGLEVAASARALGLEVHVIERQSRLLERAASVELSEHLYQKHLDKGVSILLNTDVISFSSCQGRIAGISTADGQEINCDAVLVCIGGVPNDALAKKVGLSSPNGIAVDSHFRSLEDPSIFAIGDVSYRPLSIYEMDVRLESIANANEQAKKVAHYLVNDSLIEDEVPWFWSEQYEMKIQIAGLYNLSDRSVVDKSGDDSKISISHYAGDKLVCVETVNTAKDFFIGKKSIKKSKEKFCEKT